MICKQTEKTFFTIQSLQHHNINISKVSRENGNGILEIVSTHSQLTRCWFHHANANVGWQNMTPPQNKYNALAWPSCLVNASKFKKTWLSKLAFFNDFFMTAFRYFRFSKNEGSQEKPMYQLCTITQPYTHTHPGTAELRLQGGGKLTNLINLEQVAADLVLMKGIIHAQLSKVFFS